jgi:peptidoglycan/xylan/chitin deacetylase (PgdA/CDA1 family)
LGKFYFTCSFDDGDVADLRLANLLKNYGVKATFYIPQTCDLVSKSLSGNEIRELSDLVEIGGHTISHQVLTHINSLNARAEIFNCKSWLEDITGKPVYSFCPPTGRFNRHHISLQKEAGYKAMRTVQMLSCSLEKIKKENEFVILPTTSQVYNHNDVAYLKNNIKRFQFSNYSSFKKLFDADWETMSKNYIAYLQEVSKRTDAVYYFHLWGHSWEIEKYSLWDGLERFLKSLSEIKEVVYCNNAELAEIAKIGK